MNLNEQIAHWLTDTKHIFSTSHPRAGRRPFITLCYAQSWDGSITIRSGESLALSSPTSIRLTHQLRSLHDGILVGIGTVLTDDPQLTVREWPGSSPQPIVLDSEQRMPAQARLCQNTAKRCWVLTTSAACEDSGTGPQFVSVAQDAEGRVCLDTALQLLRDRGISNLMVEGGAEVITAFIRAQLADALVLTVAPALVGGYKAVNALGITSVEQLPRIDPLFTERLDTDLIMWGNLRYGAESL